MKTYPKIKSVKALRGKKLEVYFESGIKKIYDCSSIIRKKPFSDLKEDALFKNVHVETGGYGVAWNDNIDLSESEIWLKGK